MGHFMSKDNANSVLSEYASKIKTLVPTEITWANYQLLTEEQKAAKRWLIINYPDAGGSDGSAVFTITLTGDGDETPYSIDKTYTEITDAIEAGKVVIMSYDKYEEEAPMFLQLTCTGQNYLEFGLVINYESWIISIEFTDSTNYIIQVSHEALDRDIKYYNDVSEIVRGGIYFIWGTTQATYINYDGSTTTLNKDYLYYAELSNGGIFVYEVSTPVSSSEKTTWNAKAGEFIVYIPADSSTPVETPAQVLAAYNADKQIYVEHFRYGLSSSRIRYPLTKIDVSGSVYTYWFGLTTKTSTGIEFHGIKLVTDSSGTDWDEAYDANYTFGTASTKDVPASGNASTTQVVMGNDSRLSDSRTPTAHNQAASTVTAGTLAGRVQANASAAGTLGDAQVRDIIVSTTDLTPGTSALATGTLYVVYE